MEFISPKFCHKQIELVRNNAHKRKPTMQKLKLVQYDIAKQL